MNHKETDTADDRRCTGGCASALLPFMLGNLHYKVKQSNHRTITYV